MLPDRAARGVAARASQAPAADAREAASTRPAAPLLQKNRAEARMVAGMTAAVIRRDCHPRRSLVTVRPGWAEIVLLPAVSSDALPHLQSCFYYLSTFWSPIRLWNLD